VRDGDAFASDGRRSLQQFKVLDTNDQRPARAF
jgi:hypothetical protein